MNEPRTEWPLHMVVERGKCLEMSSALRATTPMYCDADRLVAVPTMPAVLNHWGFSGSAILAELGCTLARILHGSEEFIYPNGPLREGMRLHGAMRLVSRERKTRRDGSGMLVMNFETELSDRDTGRLAVRIKRTLLELDP